MTDEDNRHVRGHPPEEDDEFIRFLRRKGTCRFIEDEKARAEAKRLDELDALLFAHGKLPDIGIGLDGQVVPFRNLGNAFFYTGKIEPEILVAFLQPEGDVFRDSHVRHEHEMLVDHANARGKGIGRRLELHRPAIDENPALVRLIKPHEYIHERGFARAILTHQGQNLIFTHRKVYGITSHDARKTLGYPFNPQLSDFFIHRAHSCHFTLCQSMESLPEEISALAFSADLRISAVRTGPTLSLN